MDYPGRALRYRSSGPAVAEVQRLLGEVAGLRVGVDGSFGYETESAVHEFQARRGLEIDGIVGRVTWEALHGAIIRGADPGSDFCRELLEVADAEADARVREVGGFNRGPRVEEYQRATGNRPGDSYCASFVYWCGLRALGKLLIERNPMPRTGLVESMWERAPAEAKVTREHLLDDLPAVCRPGVVFVMLFGNGHGHCGLVRGLLPAGTANGIIATTEGNTNELGSSNGDGVYKRSRRPAQIHGLIDYSRLQVA